jgi:hypothetical protein
VADADSRPAEPVFHPQVEPIFATPFGQATVPEAARLNPAAAALFAERAVPERAHPASRPPSMFRSRDDLLSWPEDPVRRLMGAIAGAALSVVRSVNQFTDVQFSTLQVQPRAWYSIVWPDGSVASRNFSNAAWCAIYCVGAPQPSATRHDSGLLRLHESFQSTMFSDATNTLLRAPFQSGHRTWQPVPGQMAVFPASIRHEIATLRGDGELVLVTLLLRFLAPGQQGLPWW